MKTCSLYGFISALAGAFITLVLYLLGLHSDPAKVGMAGYIALAVGLPVGILIIALGVKARREETPLTEDFGYGRALGAGVLISVVSSVLSTAFNLVYSNFINPRFPEVMVQAQLAKLEAKGMPPAQLDAAEKGVRMFMGAVPQAIFGILAGVVFGLILSLIIAAFLKRAPAEPPKV
jgi:Na+/H+-dicarboxylate symporter